MNTWLLIIGGILYAILVYQIWRGETREAIPSTSGWRARISRKTEPVKFWLNIALQLIIVTVLILVFYFVPK